MCILLSTLSTLNSIENYYYHIEFRMDSMHIKMQANSLISSCDSGRKRKILAQTGWVFICFGVVSKMLWNKAQSK